MPAIASGYTLPELHDLIPLHYVRAIVRCQSMSAAAKQLRVSQPTLSNAVRALERRLGTSLFLRGPRGVVATASGHTLARAADDVLARLHQAGDEIHGVEAAAAGRFAIGYFHSFGAVFLPPLVRELAARAPGIELSLWEAIGPRVVDAVIDRTVHFGIGVRSAIEDRLHPELVVVPLFHDTMVVVRARKRPPADAPLFHVPRITLSERVIEAMRAKRQLPARLVACGDLELIKRLVLGGAGIGVLPWRVAIQDTPPGALRVLDPKLPFEVDTGCVFYRADLHRTRGALLLRDELVRRGRELDALVLPCNVPRIAGNSRSR
jgi:DNA-binding transcriptional LysR family regulator